LYFQGIDSLDTAKDSLYSSGTYNNLWGLGTEKELGCRTARQATQAGGIDSLESISGLLKSLKIPSLLFIFYVDGCVV
jgi:hypothetical protein